MYGAKQATSIKGKIDLATCGSVAVSASDNSEMVDLFCL